MTLIGFIGFGEKQTSKDYGRRTISNPRCVLHNAALGNRLSVRLIRGKFKIRKMVKYGDIVRFHPFWRNLDARHFGVLVECANVVQFGDGQPIFQAGANAEQFYLIHSGRVGLEMFVRGKGIVAIDGVGVALESDQKLAALSLPEPRGPVL